MSLANLSEDEFRLGLSAFEGMLAGQVGRQGATAEAEVLGRVESMVPGFSVAYNQHLAAQRDIVDTIRFGNLVKKDGGYSSWYSGARIAKGEWPAYKTILESRLNQTGIDGIDLSTSRILSRCANPKEPGDRRKGLVIGHVQSGKTANYAGLIAKAVDAGYRIVIVLAGMYTNLRAQTQLRLETDLRVNDASDKFGVAWSLLTGKNEDIAAENNVGFLSSSGNVAIMVVKKHETRLASVAKFLRDIPDDTLRNRAVLVIDDESDQATPNTQSDRALVSTINQRVRAIWKEVLTGTYVAYTATPFANMFIDPNDEADMYPDDFAMVLPAPEGYMGAESFFDVSQVADNEDDEEIYGLSRVVSQDDADILVPRSRNITSYEPEITESLDDAIRWFILATAVRQIRIGHAVHSTMLLHTSHRVLAHQLLKDVVASFAEGLALDRNGEEQAFRKVFAQEIDRATHLRGEEVIPQWHEIWKTTSEILGRLTVKIDNGQSSDRLLYPDDDPQFVIAIGGGTLSRGLTLEGLVVSYFLRTSNTYDTLLQMGRWFGFRPHYQDLARVWVGPGLLEDYAHLARVEREIRSEVAVLESEGKTPRELAIRVRNHPGRLQITSPGKMSNAMVVHAGLGGSRRQTIYLDRSVTGAERSQSAARGLVRSATDRGLRPITQGSGARTRASQLISGLTNDEIVRFLGEYWVASTDPWLQADAMREWLEGYGQETQWNLVLISGPKALGEFEYSSGIVVGAVNRAPLAERYWTPDRLPDKPPADSDVVNIRALMSSADSILDLRILHEHDLLADPDDHLDSVDTNDVASVRRVRNSLAPGTGVLLLYVVSKESKPRASSKTRRDMAGSAHLIGLGVVFPHAEDEEEGEFFAVDVQQPLSDDDADEPTVFEDHEGDFVQGHE